MLPVLTALSVPGLLAAAWSCWVLTPAVRTPEAVDFAALVRAGAAWALVGCLAWATLVAAAMLVELLADGHLPALRYAGVPASWRMGLLAACGVAAFAAPAQAATDPAGLNGLTLPDRPVSAVSTPQQPPSVPTITVRSGDSLWSIARHLTDGDDASVARLVRGLHERNRAVIGDDPDVIRPGQELAVPVGSATSEIVR